MKPSIITRPEVHIAEELLEAIRTQQEFEGQVTIHFVYRNFRPFSSAMRIWPTTFLFDDGSDHVSKLVHVENITLFPTWQPVPPFSENYFTLVFSKLPKECTVFDFEEQCNGQGGEFVLRGIKRNESDVYFVLIGD